MSFAAAHCVGNQTDVDGWSIHLGLTRRTSSPIFVRKRPLSVIIKHDNFNSANLYGNDIALLKLASPVNFDEFLRPVCLPKLKLKKRQENDENAKVEAKNREFVENVRKIIYGPSLPESNHESEHESESELETSQEDEPSRETKNEGSSSNRNSNQGSSSNQNRNDRGSSSNLRPNEGSSSNQNSNDRGSSSNYYYQDLEPETRCTVVGWGKSAHDDANDYMDVIHEVEVPVVNHSLCTKWYSLQDVPIGETMLCAGYPEGQKDACQGDSGGPLLCRDSVSDPWYVAGIVSWGINCAQPNLPGM